MLLAEIRAATKQQRRGDYVTASHSQSALAGGLASEDGQVTRLGDPCLRGSCSSGRSGSPRRAALRCLASAGGRASRGSRVPARDSARRFASSVGARFGRRAASGEHAAIEQRANDSAHALPTTTRARTRILTMLARGRFPQVGAVLAQQRVVQPDPRSVRASATGPTLAQSEGVGIRGGERNGRCCALEHRTSEFGHAFPSTGRASARGWSESVLGRYPGVGGWLAALAVVAAEPRSDTS